MYPIDLFTIGHSNHSIDAFVERLHQHRIRCLVDVRSAPYSRYSPHFSKRSLQAHLRDEHINYLYLGHVLGGRPEDPDCYDEAGTVDYERIAQQAWYQQGVDQLLDVAAQQSTAMMCSEEDPSTCHRNLLITDTLLQIRRASVKHIRGDGSLETAKLKPKQTRLF